MGNQQTSLKEETSTQDQQVIPQITKNEEDTDAIKQFLAEIEAQQDPNAPKPKYIYLRGGSAVRSSQTLRSSSIKERNNKFSSPRNILQSKSFSPFKIGLVQMQENEKDKKLKSVEKANQLWSVSLEKINKSLTKDQKNKINDKERTDQISKKLYHGREINERIKSSKEQQAELQEKNELQEQQQYRARSKQVQFRHFLEIQEQLHEQSQDEERKIHEKEQKERVKQGFAVQENEEVQINEFNITQEEQQNNVNNNDEIESLQALNQELRRGLEDEQHMNEFIESSYNQGSDIFEYQNKEEKNGNGDDNEEGGGQASLFSGSRGISIYKQGENEIEDKGVRADQLQNLLQSFEAKEKQKIEQKQKFQANKETEKIGEIRRASLTQQNEMLQDKQQKQQQIIKEDKNEQNKIQQRPNIERKNNKQKQFTAKKEESKQSRRQFFEQEEEIEILNLEDENAESESKQILENKEKDYSSKQQQKVKTEQDEQTFEEQLLQEGQSTLQEFSKSRERRTKDNSLANNDSRLKTNTTKLTTENQMTPSINKTQFRTDKKQKNKKGKQIANSQNKKALMNSLKMQEVVNQLEMDEGDNIEIENDERQHIKIQDSQIMKIKEEEFKSNIKEETQDNIQKQDIVNNKNKVKKIEKKSNLHLRNKHKPLFQKEQNNKREQKVQNIAKKESLLNKESRKNSEEEVQIKDMKITELTEKKQTQEKKQNKASKDKSTEQRQNQLKARELSKESLTRKIEDKKYFESFVDYQYQEEQQLNEMQDLKPKGVHQKNNSITQQKSQSPAASFLMTSKKLATEGSKQSFSKTLKHGFGGQRYETSTINSSEDTPLKIASPQPDKLAQITEKIRKQQKRAVKQQNIQDKANQEQKQIFNYPSNDSSIINCPSLSLKDRIAKMVEKKIQEKHQVKQQQHIPLKQQFYLPTEGNTKQSEIKQRNVIKSSRWKSPQPQSLVKRMKSPEDKNKNFIIHSKKQNNIEEQKQETLKTEQSNREKDFMNRNSLNIIFKEFKQRKQDSKKKNTLKSPYTHRDGQQFQSRGKNQTQKLERTYIDPKTILRSSVISNDYYKTPLKNQTIKQEINKILSDQKEKKQQLTQQKQSTNRSQSKGSEKSVVRSYFKENEIELFGEQDPILMEGELYRFKPGIENNFLSRWVQISERAFRYYRNKYQATGMNKPVVAFPKKAIEDIEQIYINKAAFLQKRRHFNEKEKQLFDHMFEIHLREDYEDIFQYRDEEQKIIMEMKLSSRSRSVSPRSESRKSHFVASLEKRKYSYGRNSQSRQSRKSSNEGSLRGIRSDDEGKINSIYQNLVKKNKQELAKASIIQTSSTSMTNTSQYYQQKTNRIVQGHLMTVRDTNEGLQKQSYIENQELLKKKFGQKFDSMKTMTTSIGGASSWTVRMCDWYNSERRIIFATTSAKERKKWIHYFQKFGICKPIPIQLINQEEKIFQQKESQKNEQQNQEQPIINLNSHKFTFVETDQN